MKEFYTVKEVAKIFCVTERTIRNMILDGRLKFVRFTTRVLIPASEVERYKKGE